jgi:hypothetical protein
MDVLSDVLEQKANAFVLLANNPVALALFCLMILIVIAAVVIIVFNKTNPNFGNKLVELRKEINDSKILKDENNAILVTLSKRENKLEEMFTEDREERKARQSEVDEQFNKINSEFCEIKSEIKNIYEILEDHEEFAIKISHGTLEGHVFDNGYPIFRRLKSFRRGIAQGLNGRFKDKGLKLILDNQETWKDVEDTKLDIEIKNINYWNEVMAEIRRMLK